MHSIRYNKVQIIKYNSWHVSDTYMFWHWNVISRSVQEQINTSPTCQTSRLPQDGTPLPKRVGVWQLSWIVFCDLYFIVFYWVHSLVDTVNAPYTCCESLRNVWILFVTKHSRKIYSYQQYTCCVELYHEKLNLRMN